MTEVMYINFTQLLYSDGSLFVNYSVNFSQQIPVVVSLGLSVELNALCSQATDDFIVGNILALPTLMPTDMHTEPPTATAAPIKIPRPTITASVIEVSSDDPGFLESKFVTGMPVWGWGALILIIVGASTLLIRVIRRKPVTSEKCARCGFTLPMDAGLCPQCGESRQIEIQDQRR